MKALWVYSVRFLPTSEHVYCEGPIGPEVLRRYLRHFDDLVLVGRGPESNSALHQKYRTITDCPHVTVHTARSLQSPVAVIGNRQAVIDQLMELVQQVDVVIARVPSEHGILAAYVAKKAGKVLVTEVVGCARDAYWNHGSMKARLYAHIAELRTKWVVAKADFAIYVTNAYLQEKYPPHRAQVLASVSNVQLPQHTIEASDVELPDVVGGGSVELIDKTNSPAKLRPLSKRVVVGLNGSMQTRYKGHTTAFEALSLLKRDGLLERNGVEIELRLLGAGDAQVWQRRADAMGIATEVRFDGLMPPGDLVFQWLDGLDLYIQPSLTEGMPRALIEAMYRGRPAIGAAVGGIPELLAPEALHRPRDAKGLADRLLFAIKNSEWREAQAKRNFEKSLGYCESILTKKRDIFWNAVISEVTRRQRRQC